MTDVSNFGIRPAHDDSRVGRPAPGLWIPASRALDEDRPNITARLREAGTTHAAAMFLPEDLLPIVKGLSLGKPDVTTSRLLDMSPRTFTRRVAELLAYLEVETRFQAGMEVAYRWMLSARSR